jgi:hypothetical protein
MTKDDFLINKSDSSTSSNSDQQKKISKKQAKKMAKENRKNQITTDDNDKLVNKISKITLQSNHDDQKSDGNNENIKIILEEKDDKVHEMPNVIHNSSIYRRHMSESQVDLDRKSNGEFKLKVYFNKIKIHSFLHLSLILQEIIFKHCFFYF